MKDDVGARARVSESEVHPVRTPALNARRSDQRVAEVPFCEAPVSRRATTFW